MYRTIGSPVVFEGVGVHSGIRSRVELFPSQDGISFMKKGSEDTRITPTLDNVIDTTHGVRIGNSTHSFHMVEHLLGSLFAFNIDGVSIVVENGEELPILDGSAKIIAEKLKSVEVKERERGEERVEINILTPFSCSVGNSFLSVYPSDRLVVSYFISYERYPEVTQTETVTITPENFVQEIAPARTFAFLEWVKPLQEKGLIKGGNLDNSLVWSEEGLMNSAPLRYETEFVRHKILDFLGDISLLGVRVVGHFVILCGGHTSHIEFAKKLRNFLDSQNL
jgi:UDP-3-O-[3-hydroxymyristoyl] N-acetylglucosamine deacetylase